MLQFGDVSLAALFYTLSAAFALGFCNARIVFKILNASGKKTEGE